MQIERIEIERIVVEGAELANPAELAREVGAELRRITATWGPEALLARPGSAAAGDIVVDSCENITLLARAVAQQVSRSISRAAPTSHGL
jgi:hypothetical protein